MTDDAANYMQLSISEVGRALRSGSISCAELTEAHLRRISIYDGVLHSYVTIMPDDARARAATLDWALAHGHDYGPLHGIPVAVKDIFETSTVPTTMGSRLFAQHQSAEDAVVITALRDAGTVLLGKLNMDEFALGVTGTSSLFPRCVNPWAHERISGGSSSGSGCATASLLCMASLGTDTGGSIRVPAALCGVVGLKPTYGRVSKRGVLPLSWSLDHVGSLARSVNDAWLILEAIAFPDSADPSSVLGAPRLGSVSLEKGLSDLRIGVALSGIFGGAEEDVANAIELAAGVFEGLGASVERILIDSDVPGGIVTTEASVIYEDSLGRSPELFSDRIRGMLLTAQQRPVRYYATARRQQETLRRAFEVALEQVDVIVTATTPMAAPKFGELSEAEASRLLTRYTQPINFVGLPALSLPCGTTADGMPIGMQVVGRPWSEAQICAVGMAFEAERDSTWPSPPVVG